MIDAKIAADLRLMAAGLSDGTLDWPVMDEEAAPLAAVRECEAILLDAAAECTPQELPG